MRTIILEKRARDELEHIFRFIAMKNPRAAERVLDQIARSISGLAVFSTGRLGRMPGTFEKVVTDLPYIVVYAHRRKLDRETIVILSVHHTSRDFPSRDDL